MKKTLSILLLAVIISGANAYGAALVIPDRTTDLRDMPAAVCTDQYLKGSGGVYACADAAGGGGPETDPVYVAATTPIEVNTTPYAPLPANVNKLHKLNIQTTINLPMTGFVAGDRLLFLSIGEEGFTHTFVSEGELWQAYIKVGYDDSLVGPGDTLSFETLGAPGESYVFQFTDQWVLIDAFDLKYAYQSDKHTQGADQALDTGGANEVTAATLKTLADNTSGTNTGDQDLSGLVPNTRTVAGHALNADVTITAGDVGAAATTHAHSPSDVTGTAVITSDSRLSDARTPTAHNQDATTITTGVLAPDRLATGTGLQVLRRNTGNTALEFATLAGGNGYIQHVSFSSSNPTDSSTLYFSHVNWTLLSSATLLRVPVIKSGTIKAASIFTYANTAAGSGEDISVYVRVNNTTDTLIATVGSATAERIFTNTNLSISVSVGDTFNIKMVNPAWATNPIAMFGSGSIYIE